MPVNTLSDFFGFNSFFRKTTSESEISSKGKQRVEDREHILSKLAENHPRFESKPLADLGIEPLDSGIHDKSGEFAIQYLSRKETDSQNEVKNLFLDEVKKKLRKLNSSNARLSESEIDRIANKFIAHNKKSFGEDLTTEQENLALKDLDTARLLDVEGKKILLFQEPIGQGTKGEIFLGITANGKMCAVKHYLQPESSIGREASVLARCDGSAHIIQQYAANDEFLVLEFCRYSLENLDYQNESIDPQFLDQYIRDALGFLIELKEKGVIHLDIKPDNLRLRLGHLKLLDFDTAFLADEHQNIIGGGTIGYYDPRQIAFYCQNNQELLKTYGVSGVNIALPQIPLSFPTNTWQTMITLAEFGQLSLSPPFQERFQEYQKEIIRDCAHKARESIANSEWLAKSGLSFLDFQKKCPTEFNARFTLLYMGFAYQKFEEWKQKRPGLFSDLTPETPFEQLLIDMSFFDEDRRILPEAIQQRLTETPNLLN